MYVLIIIIILKLDTKILILWDSLLHQKFTYFFPKFQCLAYLAKSSISIITNGLSLSWSFYKIELSDLNSWGHVTLWHRIVNKCFTALCILNLYLFLSHSSILSAFSHCSIITLSWQRSPICQGSVSLRINLLSSRFKRIPSLKLWWG